MYWILGIQIGTYFALGAWFLADGNTKLAVAQFLLAGVQAAVFS